MTLSTFRIHFSDGTAMDVTAESADDAKQEARARKRSAVAHVRGPGALTPYIIKTKLLREA